MRELHAPHRRSGDASGTRAIPHHPLGWSVGGRAANLASICDVSTYTFEVLGAETMSSHDKRKQRNDANVPPKGKGERGKGERGRHSEDECDL